MQQKSELPSWGGKRAGAGRPKLRRGNIRTCLTVFRLTESERQKIESQAKAAGLELSLWIRKTLLGADYTIEPSVQHP